MQQYQAAYILESVSKELKKLSTDKTLGLKVTGLLQSLSTFDAQASVNLELPKVKHSLMEGNGSLRRFRYKIPIKTDCQHVKVSFRLK